ncbi:MAG: hypothetical protein RLZZ200_1046, partial [Pseudomonadota bacterium]
ALAFAVLVVMGLGLNTVFPTWYSGQHGGTVASASSLYATLNFTMILGGLGTATLLGRGVGAVKLFRCLAALAFAAALGIFVPGTGTTVLFAALVLWLLVSGAATAVVTSSLPRVIENPAQGAAAAGLLSQIAALTTFVTPQLWIHVLGTGPGAWVVFLSIIAACWLLALWLLPVRDR